MRLILACILIFSLCSFRSSAQESNIANIQHVYLELGGAGPYWSVNYELSFLQRETFAFTTRVGFSSMKIVDYRRKFNPDIIVPLTFSFIYGKRHCIEVLAGNTFSNRVLATNYYESDREIRMNGNYGIFYRYRMERIPGIIRIGYNPIFEDYRTYRHWFALSLGYSF